MAAYQFAGSALVINKRLKTFKLNLYWVRSHMEAEVKACRTPGHCARHAGETVMHFVPLSAFERGP